MRIQTRIAAILLAIALIAITLLPVNVRPVSDGILSISLGQASANPDSNISGWTINGSTVYIDNDRVYLSATPHTLTSSGWVEFELLSKNWSGEIDVIWGFPADLGVKPRQPQRWALNVSHEKSHTITVEQEYTLNVCNISEWSQLEWGSITPDIGNTNNTFIYNVTAADWKCTGISGNYTSYIIAFNSYEGNKAHAIFYGNRDVEEEEIYYEYYDDWVSWNPPPMQTVSYAYAGVDTWYVVKLDKAIDAGKTYKVRCWLDEPIQLGNWQIKYAWAIKPSAETIQEAKANGHLYLLDPWLSGGWNKRIKLTSDNTKVDSDLTHFPITVFLKSGNGETTKVFDEVGANKYKIAIADDSATPVQYYVEIEKWDNTGQEAVLHFGKSGETLPSASDKDYYLYYDNSHADNTGYVGDIDSTPGHNVWDSNFRAVYHMVDATTSSIKDSTSNNDDGTKASASSPSEAIGKIGKGQDYDGNGDYITFSPYSSNDGTISAWVKSSADSAGAVYGCMDNSDVDGEGGWLTIGDGATAYLENELITWNENYGTKNRIGYCTATRTELFDGNWHHTALVAGSSYSIYLDGVSKTITVGQGSNNGEFIHNAGGLNDAISGRVYWNGATYQKLTAVLDELRISNTARSAAWIKATYNSLNDSLLTYGNEETKTPEITNAPGTYGFGTVSVGGTANTSINYFTITNTGNVAVDVTIQGTDATGGDDTWTLSDTATPGENIYGLKAGLDDADDTFDVVVKKSTPYNTLVSNLAEDATLDWGLKIYMPTSLSGYDAQQMSGTVTLVASAAA